MIVLNFSHPLTDDQLDQIARAFGVDDVNFIDIPTHFDTQTAIEPQIVKLIKENGIDKLTKDMFVVRLPALDAGCAVLLAVFNGLFGFFPNVITFRKKPNAIAATFELWQVVDLQYVRDMAWAFCEYGAEA